MKKLFAFFLALALVFLTACNTNPPVGTNADGSTASGSQGGNNGGTTNNSDNSHKWDWSETLQNKLIESSYVELLNIPSRVLFQATLNGQERTYYYSKVDGNAYVYCFDPICDHTDYTCLGNPFVSGLEQEWYFNQTFFINNRFYCMNDLGRIYSFAFDGTDKKLEYDAKYSRSIWAGYGAYGPYIYIDSRAEEDRHTWRYNVETKEMEDLTEKTGNYVYPHFFYNGMLYGTGDGFKTGDTFFKADLDLNTAEEISPSIIPMELCAGNIFVGIATKGRESITEAVKKIGISFYDLGTGEQRIVTTEDLGLDFYPSFIASTDEYFYFCNPKWITIGTRTVIRNGQEIEVKEQKRSDGKLYRMDRDGTNIVCVYDNPEYEFGHQAIIDGDRIIMQGQYVKFEDGQKKTWGGPIQVATINPDGTIGEFVEVEVLQ